MENGEMDKALLTTEEASKYLGGAISVSLLNHLRCDQAADGPAWVKIGRRVRYRKEDLDKFIEKRIVDPRYFARKHG